MRYTIHQLVTMPVEELHRYARDMSRRCLKGPMPSNEEFENYRAALCERTGMTAQQLLNHFSREAQHG